ncbi:hypothetical protein GGR50DRAFT_93724 [Xylaria sp. CBS 124048]|nr:hypothetical protein GGR50DRAFT_93724 [Xylaria sp. CBS 124048]
MQLHQYFLSLAAALPFFASLALGKKLAPWHVTGLRTWEPSGRPGNDPHWFDYANITNPDPTQTETDPGIAQGVVFCNISWIYPDAPYNKPRDCQILDTTTSTTWAWTIELLMADANTWPVSNFGLRWRAASTAFPTGPSAQKGVQIWTGAGQFEAGKNLDYICGASGVCSGKLKSTSTPVLINVTSVSCHGTLQEALHGMKCD